MLGYVVFLFCTCYVSRQPAPYNMAREGKPEENEKVNFYNSLNILKRKIKTRRRRTMDRSRMFQKKRNEHEKVHCPWCDAAFPAGGPDLEIHVEQHLAQVNILLFDHLFWASLAFEASGAGKLLLMWLVLSLLQDSPHQNSMGNMTFRCWTALSVERCLTRRSSRITRSTCSSTSQNRLDVSKEKLIWSFCSPNYFLEVSSIFIVLFRVRVWLISALGDGTWELIRLQVIQQYLCFVNMWHGTVLFGIFVSTYD